MSGHTAGPWEYSRTPFARGWRTTVSSRGVRKVGVATMTSDPNSTETAVANARLIAAAPELLEAAKNAAYKMAADDERDSLPPSLEHQQLRQAIGKAIGNAS